MLIHIWGARGSLPSPVLNKSAYGGNTPCVEVRAMDNDLIIFDGGSGLFELGEDLMRRTEKLQRVHIFISHLHWDHIMGLPFFAPAFSRDFEVHVYYPRDIFSKGANPFDIQLNNSNLSASERANYRVAYHPIDEGVTIEIETCRIDTQALYHPALDWGYRLTSAQHTVCYCNDCELGGGALWRRGTDIEAVRSGAIALDEAIFHPGNRRLANFVAGADLLIQDTMYDREEYRTKMGWGHSPYDFAVELAYAMRVKRLLMFHFAPTHSDEVISGLLSKAEALAARYDGHLAIAAAKEGQEILL